MNHDDVLRLAREAGIEYAAAKGYCVHAAVLHKFAALIRAEVLEEAARICDRGAQVSPDRRVGVGCARCATAIRAAKEGS